MVGIIIIFFFMVVLLLRILGAEESRLVSKLGIPQQFSSWKSGGTFDRGLRYQKLGLYFSIVECRGSERRGTRVEIKTLALRF